MGTDQSQNEASVIFTPDNEPYLGRQSVYGFDQVIISCLAANAEVAVYTRTESLTDLQKAACQIIPQGINLALSIRELIRQGYLFAAVVLMRSLLERAAMISHLYAHQEDLTIWRNGWKRKEGRPELQQMMTAMTDTITQTDADGICKLFNHITHGDPIGSSYNLVELGEGGLGYSVGRVTDHPDLCDFICYQAYCYLIVLMGMMTACFPRITQG